MKKILILIGLTMFTSCQTEKERKALYDREMKNIKIYSLKQVSRGKYSPDFYIVDYGRNSYEIRPSDYVRLRENDSIKINTSYIYTEIIEIY